MLVGHTLTMRRVQGLESQWSLRTFCPRGVGMSPKCVFGGATFLSRSAWWTRMSTLRGTVSGLTRISLDGLVARKIPRCLSLRSTVRAGGECDSGVRHGRRFWSGRSADARQSLRSEPTLELKRLAGRTVPAAGAIRPSQPCRPTMRPPPMCRARGWGHRRRCR